MFLIFDTETTGLPLDKNAFWKRIAALTVPLSALAYLAFWFLGNM